MTMLIEGPRSVFLGSQAFLLEDDREVAWAETHIVKNPAIKYVLGRYVGADQANENGQIFDLAELGEAQKMIANSPLNLFHQAHRIVGNFIASELIYPTEATAAAESPLHPYVEALSAFWRYYFPDEFVAVEKAHKEGTLYYSMECVPKTIKCAAVCGNEYAYDGRNSDTYCAHLNAPGGHKLLRQPHFVGGALILPPAMPGWKKADITQMSQLILDHAEEAATVYQAVKTDLPHLVERDWEAMVAEVLKMTYLEMEGEWAKTITMPKRMALAKQGRAMPDGSYPIESPQDLADAIKAFGRAKPSDKTKVRAHIKRNAKTLGKEDLLPDGWDS